MHGVFINVEYYIILPNFADSFCFVSSITSTKQCINPSWINSPVTLGELLTKYIEGSCLSPNEIK